MQKRKYLIILSAVIFIMIVIAFAYLKFVKVGNPERTYEIEITDRDGNPIHPELKEAMLREFLAKRDAGRPGPVVINVDGTPISEELKGLIAEIYSSDDISPEEKEIRVSEILAQRPIPDRDTTEETNSDKDQFLQNEWSIIAS